MLAFRAASHNYEPMRMDSHLAETWTGSSGFQALELRVGGYGLLWTLQELRVLLSQIFVRCPCFLKFRNCSFMAWRGFQASIFLFLSSPDRRSNAFGTCVRLVKPETVNTLFVLLLYYCCSSLASWSLGFRLRIIHKGVLCAP